MSVVRQIQAITTSGDLVGLLADSSGQLIVAMATAQQPGELTSYDYSITTTSAAIGSTADLSGYGMPFRNLVFAKSASANAVELNLNVNGSGVGMFVVNSLGAETLTVTALINGTNSSQPIMIKTHSGVVGAASALASGTYYIVNR